GEPTGPLEVSRTVSVGTLDPNSVRSAVRAVMQEYNIPEVLKAEPGIEEAIRCCIRINEKEERFIDPMAFVAALRKQVPGIKTGDFGRLKVFTHDLVRQYLSGLSGGKQPTAKVPIAPKKAGSEQKQYATAAGFYAAIELIGSIKGVSERIPSGEVNNYLTPLVRIFIANAYYTNKVAFIREKIVPAIRANHFLASIFQCDDSTLARALDFSIAEACQNLDMAADHQARIQLTNARREEILGSRMWLDCSK
ncbi:MAG: hypothetical protein ABIE84_04025, partial [bacterium]